ncbi:MAG TPA: metallophosphoesterase [Haliangiales bacterium]|nr:metallophosphoesterase [Haliangiales bacterium]
MSRIAVIFTIATSIIVGVHVYIWFRLVRETALPPPWRAIATLALILLGASIPTMFLLRGNPVARDVLKWPGYAWMGFMFILFFALLASDVARLVAWIGGRLGGAPPADPARRLWLSRMIGGSVAALAGGAGAAAMVSALGRVKVKEVEIPLRRLPASMDGFTVAQITDCHVGSMLGRAFLAEVVESINAMKPDLVAITGDLVDGGVDELAAAVAPLADLRAKHGVYFVTGNHEYYSGVEAWMAHLPSLGIRVLRNERVTIGEGEVSFDLAGIDDWNARGMAPGHGPDLRGALAGRDPRRELVLLAHQPRAVIEAAALGVGLQLSGHTHGGQIWPWTYFVYLQQPFVAGLGRERDTHIYVSRGTGFWGPPMRLLAPAEITKVVLRSVV